MKENAFAGALIRMLRLEKNWSQETLCQGICAVSYLSKIEQGRVVPNEAMLSDLFGRMGYTWQEDTNTQAAKVCEEAYEAIFSGNPRVTKACKTMLMEPWESKTAAPWYLDLMVLRAFYCGDTTYVPEQLMELLDERQSCLILILQNQPEQALLRYPCALAALEAGTKAYAEGQYTTALDYLQRCYDDAARQGYIYLMMYSRSYMANCYSDLRDLSSMLSHCTVAQRLADLLGEETLSRTIAYNIASTKLECGDYEAALAFFSNVKDPDVMSLHKLAICYEQLGKREDAIATLDRAEPLSKDLEISMLQLVRCRLEHDDYLHDSNYGTLLLDTFQRLRKERSSGFARFHFRWIEEWCSANRQYRQLYEIMRDFL